MEFAMDVNKIKSIIPHRYPFLLIDRVLKIEGMKAIGVKSVTANEPFFQGHFPENPVMPGVLITEAMAQLGAVLIMSQEQWSDCIPYLAALDNLRFKRPVVPGEQLIIEVEITNIKRNVGKMKAKATVDGVLAAEGEMMCSMVKR